MELIVVHRDREEKVVVRRTPTGHRVTVGETVYQVDSAVIGRGLWSLRIDGRQHEVAVQRERDGRYSVGSGEGSASVAVTDPLTHLARRSKGGAGRRRSEQVTALMPGRVVAVLAAEGEEVAAGQGVVVLEAMKMENEIAAEHAGTVRKLFVEPGQAVEGGDPLFEIE